MPSVWIALKLMIHTLGYHILRKERCDFILFLPILSFTYGHLANKIGGSHQGVRDLCSSISICVMKKQQAPK